MSVTFPPPAAACLAVIAVALGAPAAAADAVQVADDIVAALTAPGDVEASYADATESGGEVTISGFRMVGARDAAIEIPTIVVVNPVERAEGGFVADAIRFDGGTMTDDDAVVRWATGEVVDPTVLTPGEIRDMAHIAPFSRFTLSQIQVEPEDRSDTVDIDRIEMTLANVADGAPEGTFRIDRLVVTSAMFDDAPEQKAMIEALGYDRFTIDVLLDVGYDSAEQSVTVRTVRIDTADVGTLAITGSFSGLPLGKLQDPGQLSELGETAMVDNAEIRFDNTGIVDRLLDMQAEQQGRSREELVDDLSMGLTALWGMIGNAAFESQVAAATDAFLRDPRSLTLAVAPGSPIAVMQIVDVAMRAPQTLPDLLSAEVTANAAQ